MNHNDEVDRLIRDPEVEEMVGLGGRQRRNLEAQGLFTKRVLIAEGGRAVAWSYVEVQNYVRARLALRAKPNARMLPPRGEAANKPAAG